MADHIKQARRLAIYYSGLMRATEDFLRRLEAGDSLSDLGPILANRAFYAMSLRDAQRDIGTELIPDGDLAAIIERKS